MKIRVNDTDLEIIQGDITEQATDAIVNAANSQLILGGGVAGAIRQKGGPSIQSECDQKSPSQVGHAVITGAGNLKAKYVIHTVGPRMGEGDEDRKLKNATINTLVVADKNNLKSLSFCAVSTGIFGFPMNRCAEIMLKNTIEYLKGKTSLEKVFFCLFDKNAFDTFSKVLKSLEMSFVQEK